MQTCTHLAKLLCVEYSFFQFEGLFCRNWNAFLIACLIEALGTEEEEAGLRNVLWKIGFEHTETQIWERQESYDLEAGGPFAMAALGLSSPGLDWAPCSCERGRCCYQTFPSLFKSHSVTPGTPSP